MVSGSAFLFPGGVVTPEPRPFMARTSYSVTERLSRLRGLQRQSERDRKATETPAQKELIDYSQWDRSRSPKMLSIPLVYVCVCVRACVRVCVRVC